jgi:hypothetical protein
MAGIPGTIVTVITVVLVVIWCVWLLGALGLLSGGTVRIGMLQPFSAMLA